MNSKQRFTFMFVLVSLTMTMLFFQNCSPTGGVFNSSSVTDDFIVDPPIIFAAKNSACTTIATAFKTNETVYICIRDAGVAPIYCHAFSSATTCDKVTVATPIWTNQGSGAWMKAFSPASGLGFPVGTFTAYVVHTDDPNAVSNTSFTVAQ